MEGFAFAAKGKQHEIGGLGWIIRVALDEAGIRWVEVPPTSLKMFATGRGNANKSEVVVAAVQRLGLTPKDDNQADAAWLEEFGHHLLGKPRTDLPQLHLRALDKVRLPT
jgi:crossover junction endodeoxyribonuclease RuvC